jgi:hypothetical protein
VEAAAGGSLDEEPLLSGDAAAAAAADLDSNLERSEHSDALAAVDNSAQGFMVTPAESAPSAEEVMLWRLVDRKGNF